MKRNSKQRGSGGRLRLGLLMATAAAFLLVPAAQAMAAPELHVNIISQPGASGEVFSSSGPFEGSPPIDCSTIPGEEAFVCDNEMTPVEDLSGNILRWQVGLNSLPGPESERWKWEVVSGEVHALCNPGNATCSVKSFDENEDAEVNVYFENEVSELRVNLVGLNGAGGEVVSPNSLAPFPGTPPIECWLEEGDEGPAEQQGVCENEMEEVAPGEFGVAMEQLTGSAAHPAPNSEHVAWEFVEGAGLPAPGQCEPGSSFCIAADPGGDVEVNVKFDCKPGETCPPPKPEFPLNLSISSSNGGSGTLDCKVEGGPAEACVSGTEYEEGTEVEVLANADTGSEFVAWTGCDSEPGGNCLVDMNEEEDVDAQFDLETFTLTLNPPIGAGTLTAECDYGSGFEACVSLTEIDYGTGILVIADPDPENSVESLTGSGSASGCSSAAGPEETATCEFTIEADSEVSVAFAGAKGQEKDPGNVFGEVDQQTTLETLNCDNVDLGPFVPSKVQEEYPNSECVVTATATGEINELTAADEEPSQGLTDLTGHLTQEPGDAFTLNNALEVQGETAGFSGNGVDTGEFLPLSSTVHLVDYPEPVSYDEVTVNFRQLIDGFEGLHTGTYSKTITLTLKQTEP